MGDRVAAVVLNWCSYEDTRACVAALAASEGAELVTIVVDNASPDGSGDRLRRDLPGLEHVQTGGNLGYAGGNNHGIARARDLGADRVLLLNPDVIVSADCVSRLARTMSADPRAALVAAKVLHAHDGTIGAVGGDIWWPLAEARQRGHGEADRGQYASVSEVDFAPGTVVLARMTAIDEVGPMPEEYFLYFEDVDWSLRFRARGWRILADPTAVAIHRESSTVGRDSPLKGYYYVRNSLHFLDRWVEREERVRVRRRFERKLMKMLVKEGIRGRFGTARAMWRGRSDHHAGILGIAPAQ